jgi:hypothetical protein
VRLSIPTVTGIICVPRHHSPDSHQRTVITRVLGKTTRRQTDAEANDVLAPICQVMLVGGDKCYCRGKRGDRTQESIPFSPTLLGCTARGVSDATAASTRGAANRKTSLGRLYAAQLALPSSICMHSAITGTDSHALTHLLSCEKMPMRSSAVPKHIPEIGMAFRGWGVDYEGTRVFGCPAQKRRGCWCGLCRLDRIESPRGTHGLRHRRHYSRLSERSRDNCYK